MPLEAELIVVEGLRFFDVGHREVNRHAGNVHVFLLPSAQSLNAAARFRGRPSKRNLTSRSVRLPARELPARRLSSAHGSIRTPRSPEVIVRIERVPTSLACGLDHRDRPATCLTRLRDSCRSRPRRRSARSLDAADVLRTTDVAVPVAMSFRSSVSFACRYSATDLPG